MCNSLIEQHLKSNSERLNDQVECSLCPWKSHKLNCGLTALNFHAVVHLKCQQSFDYIDIEHCNAPKYFKWNIKIVMPVKCTVV